jgi:hypothetical protein
MIGLSGLAAGWLLAAAGGWAAEPAVLQPDAGLSSAYEPGAIQPLGSGVGIIQDFGSIRRYQFASPSGEIQSGTLHGFGSQLSPPTTPMIVGPPMRVAPLIPVVPMLPVGPNGGLTPVVPNIGVITPGQAPGSSTWGTKR